MNICYIQAPAKQDHTMVVKSTSPQLNLYGDCPTSSDVLPEQKGWQQSRLQRRMAEPVVPSLPERVDKSSALEF